MDVDAATGATHGYDPLFPPTCHCPIFSRPSSLSFHFKVILIKICFPLFADLVHCTNEPNVSIPHLANLLVERSQNANWVVVYKALITAHHLLAYGNEVRTHR